jgi:phospholipid/cholesterol/gamma-HCH transport system substrate-binding protein
MNSKREQVWVGIFVVVTSAVLIGVTLSVSGAFAKKGTDYRAYFKYSGGLEPGAPVRYGGFLAGKIQSLRIDPSDTTQIEITFLVYPEIPVKTDSMVRLTSLGALGSSYLEISTGTKGATLAPPGSVIKSKETVGLGDLGDVIGGMVPTADQVMTNLNNRLIEMKVTIANVNDLLGEPNRKNIAASLTNINGMLTDSRPKVSATLNNVQTATDKLSPVLTNVQAASEKISPLLDDLKGTIKEANQALSHIDSIMAENRPDIRASMEQTHKMLISVSQLVDTLKDTMDHNTDNIGETMANIRAATENIKEMTDTLKRKPSVLIRGETGKDRVPGATK